MKYIALEIHPPKALPYIGTHHPTHPPQELPHLHRLGSQNDRPKFKTKITQHTYPLDKGQCSIDNDLKKFIIMYTHGNTFILCLDWNLIGNRNIVIQCLCQFLTDLQ